MTVLYQKVLASEPVEYLEELFCKMIQQGFWRKADPKQMAIEFFAPFTLLLSVSDSVSGNEEKDKIATLFLTHMECFTERYAKKNQ